MSEQLAKNKPICGFVVRLGALTQAAYQWQVNETAALQLRREFGEKARIRPMPSFLLMSNVDGQARRRTGRAISTTAGS